MGMGPVSIIHLNILLDYHCIVYRVYVVKLKIKILKGSLIILKVEISLITCRFKSCLVTCHTYRLHNHITIALLISH